MKSDSVSSDHVSTYLILTANDGFSLMEMVETHIADGYKAVGGVSVTFFGHYKEGRYQGNPIMQYTQAVALPGAIS